MNRTTWPVLRNRSKSIFFIAALLCGGLLPYQGHAESIKILPYKLVISTDKSKVKTNEPVTFTIRAIDRSNEANTYDTNISFNFVLSSRESSTTDRIDMKNGLATISKTFSKTGYFISTIRNRKNPEAREYSASAFVTVLP